MVRSDIAKDRAATLVQDGKLLYEMGKLDEAEATRLIEQLAELKPPMLILTGGDPLMRRDVLDLVRLATSKGLHVGLSPSATARLLSADFGEMVAAA